MFPSRRSVSILTVLCHVKLAAKHALLVRLAVVRSCQAVPTFKHDLGFIATTGLHEEVL